MTDLRSPYRRKRKRVFEAKAPEIIPDADWQAGASPGNYELRPMLSGEPVVGAYAARSGIRGWVRVRPSDGEESLLLRGRVTLVGIPLAER